MPSLSGAGRQTDRVQLETTKPLVWKGDGERLDVALSIPFFVRAGLESGGEVSIEHWFALLP